MATRTVYVVSKIGWEYNDENYYRPESEGGLPVLVFSTKEKAQAECDKRNAPLLKEDADEYYRREATGQEKLDGLADEYGLIPITTDFEVIPVEFQHVEVED
jgi:siderophore synthetase component